MNINNSQNYPITQNDHEFIQSHDVTYSYDLSRQECLLTINRKILKIDVFQKNNNDSSSSLQLDKNQMEATAIKVAIMIIHMNLIKEKNHSQIRITQEGFFEGSSDHPMAHDEQKTYPHFTALENYLLGKNSQDQESTIKELPETNPLDNLLDPNEIPLKPVSNPESPISQDVQDSSLRDPTIDKLRHFSVNDPVCIGRVGLQNFLNPHLLIPKKDKQRIDPLPTKEEEVKLAIEVTQAPPPKKEKKAKEKPGLLGNIRNFLSNLGQPKKDDQDLDVSRNLLASERRRGGRLQALFSLRANEKPIPKKQDTFSRKQTPRSGPNKSEQDLENNLLKSPFND